MATMIQSLVFILLRATILYPAILASAGARKQLRAAILPLPPLPLASPGSGAVSFLESGLQDGSRQPHLGPPVKDGDTPLYGVVKNSMKHFPPEKKPPKEDKPPTQLGPESFHNGPASPNAPTVPPKGTPAPTQIPPMPDRGSVMQAVIDGEATWDGGEPLKGWEMKFFYNTQDRSMWGCNQNDAGNEVETMRKCVVKGPVSRFQKDGTLNVDIVVQGTGQVNRYKGKVEPCPGGKESCPGKERKFTGEIETQVAGTLSDGSVVGSPGLKGKVTGTFKDVAAPTGTDL